LATPLLRLREKLSKIVFNDSINNLV
jgi:hypothetical protein